MIAANGTVPSAWRKNCWTLDTARNASIFGVRCQQNPQIRDLKQVRRGQARLAWFEDYLIVIHNQLCLLSAMNGLIWNERPESTFHAWVHSLNCLYEHEAANRLPVTIDYRCDNRIFLLSRVHPQLSSSNPEFSKPKNRTANSDFRSRLINCLEDWNAQFLTCRSIYRKKANSEKLGLGIDNPCRIVFSSLRMNKCLERVNDRHFWNPGVFSYAMILRCRPNSRVIFSLSHL
jgi:hypothetical protein